ncbi:MAG: hypothetical protein AAGG48_03245 [Planctomycetota bacterium]
MTFQDCLIVQRESGWSLIVGSETETLSADATMEELATCVEVMSRLAGLKRFQCVLAPASTSCFFVQLNVPVDTDLRDRVELTYALEDHLPIDAESMVADFQPIPPPSVPEPQQLDAKSVAAVSLPLEPWRTLAERLETAGITVRAIVPASLLAVGVLAAQDDLSSDYLLVEGGFCDWISVHRGIVVDWKRVPLDSASLERQLALRPSEADRTVIVTDDSEVVAQLESVFKKSEIVDRSLEPLQLQGTEQVLKRRLRTFDLRREQLGPPDPLRPIQTPVRLAFASAIALLVAIAFAGWFRTQRIEAAITDLQVEQQSLFREAFPDTRVPAALLRRVRSEHARVMASRGRSGDVDLPVSGHTVLSQLIMALPDDLRYRVTKIEIDNGNVDLELQVRSPVDAGTLASRLSTAGFIVKPPVTTQSDAKTFDSTLEAEWSGTVSSQTTVSLHWSPMQESRG